MVGNTVVLAKKITGRSDGQVNNSIMTYKTEGNQITQVYFQLPAIVPTYIVHISYSIQFSPCYRSLNVTTHLR